MQKIILPLLVTVIAVFLFVLYFVPKDDLGTFGSFDTNSNANQDIIVELVHEKGFSRDADAGTIFYVKDKTGREVKVHGPIQLPPGLDMTPRLTLRGHLHADYFHAVEITPRN